MCARITEEQHHLLEKLVDAYWSNAEGDAKEDFYFGASMGSGPTIEHRSLDEEALDVGDLEELEALGLVSVKWENDLSGRARPTAEGRHLVEEQRSASQAAVAGAAPTTGGPGISWEVTRPILQAIVALYDQGGPGDDVALAHVCGELGREAEDPGVRRAVEVLIDGGYIETKLSAWGMPVAVAPKERALQLFAGWPASGEEAVLKLLSILGERIEQASDEEEKGKLRKLRDSVVDIGESVTAEVLVKLMTG